MTIEVIRKWKKESYTIGELYVNGERFCNTLEPVDRGLLKGMTVGTIRKKKVYGRTAIPSGEYKIKMNIMASRKKVRPQIMDVPAFFGVFIHEGNTVKDTKGCILLGDNTQKGMVLNSRKRVLELGSLIDEAEENEESVTIIIGPTPLTPSR